MTDTIHSGPRTHCPCGRRLGRGNRSGLCFCCYRTASFETKRRSALEQRDPQIDLDLIDQPRRTRPGVVEAALAT